MSFKIDYIPDFIDDVAPKMVEAGMKVLEPVLRANMDDAIKKGTGELKRTTGLSEVKHYTNSGGAERFRKVIYFGGERQRKNRSIRNNEIAAYLNYGRPHTPQNPMKGTHFIDNAAKKTKKNVEAAMERVFDEETGRG